MTARIAFAAWICIWLCNNAPGQQPWQAESNLAPVISRVAFQEEIHGAEIQNTMPAPVGAAPIVPPHSSSGCDSSCGAGCDSPSAPYQIGNYHCNSHCCSAGGVDECVARCAPGNLYLNLFSGGVSLDPYRGAAQPPQPPPMNFVDPQEITFNDGFALGIALGERVRPRVRREVEFAWRNNTGENLLLNVVQPRNQFQQIVPLDGQVNFFSTLANCYVDLLAFRGWRSNFYVGGGIGFGFIDVDLIGNHIMAAYADQSVFVYQGIAGWNYRLTQRVEGFAEYRFFGTDNIHLDVADFNSGVVGNMAGDYYDRRFRYLAHNFFFGFRVILR